MVLCVAVVIVVVVVISIVVVFLGVVDNKGILVVVGTIM